MKPKPQPIITLDTISDALQTHSLADARALLADSAGARLTVTGTLLKLVKRDGLRLVIKAEAKNRSFEIYANSSDPAERQRFLDARIKKNSQVSVIGKFQTFGTYAVTLSDCRWES